MKQLLAVRSPFIVGCLLLLAGCSAQGQSGSNGTLLILSKADHVLVLADPASLKIKARIPVGEDPHEVIASTDGTTAFVTIYGGGSLHTLNVIDLHNKKRLPDVDTRPLYGPHGIVYVKDKVWFSAEGSKSIGRYDPSTSSVDWSMGTGQDRTHMIYLRKDGKEAYTTNVNEGTVSILSDSSTNGRSPHEWTQTVVPTAKGSEGFDVTADGTELWTASSNDGSISIIDLVAKKRVINFKAQVEGANRLAFTPDSKLVFITSLSQGDVFIFDRESRKEIKRVRIGRGAAGILMDPDGSRAFVACTPDNYVAVIDLRTLEITGRIELGAPDGMAWATTK